MQDSIHGVFDPHTKVLYKRFFDKIDMLDIQTSICENSISNDGAQGIATGVRSFQDLHREGPLVEEIQNRVRIVLSDYFPDIQES